jgi:asparagine synthase (glutamine-hydrolysing)
MRDWLGESNPGALYGRTLANSWWANDVRTLIGTEFVANETTASFPGNLAEQMCLWDLHNYLPGDILAKVDRATMATGLEGREPLLDHELVEFAFRLPLALRRGPLGPKHLLRRVLYKYVPQRLVERPKMGFGVPLGAWLRGDLRTLVGDHLSPSQIKAQAILDPDAVKRTVAVFDAGDHHAVNRVWSLVAFQLWHERWHGQRRASRSSTPIPLEARTA